jgi:hypothetical protein
MVISRALKDAPEFAGLFRDALALEACIRDVTELYVWGLGEDHPTARAVRQAILQRGCDTRSLRAMEELLGLQKNSVPAFAARS